VKKLSEGEAKIVNNLSPGDQNVALGDRIRDLEEHALVELAYEVASDLTGGLDAIRCPFDLEVLDVFAQARATSAGGTVTARKETDAISSAVVMAADMAIARTVSIDDDYSSFTEGQYINLVTNGAADRGLVTVIARRV